MTAVASTGPLSTPGLAAHITWKQLDVICVLLNDEDDYPGRALTTRAVSEWLQEWHEEMVAEFTVRYWGTSYSSAYAALTTLERRGLVTRDPVGRWRVTRRGADAFNLI